jgi:hypothetical protein
LSVLITRGAGWFSPTLHRQQIGLSEQYYCSLETIRQAAMLQCHRLPRGRRI